MLYPAPIVTERIAKLPVYLLTAGEQHNQETRDRPKGVPFYHLFFVLEGEMLLRTPVGENCYPAGTVLLLPSNYPTYYSAAHGHLISGWLTFNGPCVDNLLSYFQLSGVQAASVEPLMPQYLHIFRIEAAKRRLLETQDPVSQIGADCGFHDRAHFCKIFRRLVGVSPLTFRNNYR